MRGYFRLRPLWNQPPCIRPLWRGIQADAPGHLTRGSQRQKRAVAPKRQHIAPMPAEGVAGLAGRYHGKGAIGCGQIHHAAKAGAMHRGKARAPEGGAGHGFAIPTRSSAQAQPIAQIGDEAQNGVVELRDMGRAPAPLARFGTMLRRQRRHRFSQGRRQQGRAAPFPAPARSRIAALQQWPQEFGGRRKTIRRQLGARQ